MLGLKLLIVAPTKLPVFPCPLRSASAVPPINGQNPTSPLVTEAGDSFDLNNLTRRERPVVDLDIGDQSLNVSIITP